MIQKDGLGTVVTVLEGLEGVIAVGSPPQPQGRMPRFLSSSQDGVVHRATPSSPIAIVDSGEAVDFQRG